MKIAVDIRCLSGSGYYEGISQYTKNVLISLTKNKEHNFLLFPGFNSIRNNNIKTLGFSNDDNIRLVWSPIPMGIIEKLWKFNWPPVEALVGHADIFFAPNFFLPPVKQAKTVATIHDLSFVYNPKWFPKNEAKIRQLNLIKTLKNADAIIAVSNFTAGEIKNSFPEISNKIFTIYEAPSPVFKFRNSSETSSVKKRFNLENDIILYVGALEPRKNLIALINGFLKLRSAEKTKSQLVIAGLPGYKSQEIMFAAREGIVRNWIRFPGYIPQEDMPALYSAAKLFCYLSSYEGFGLPPLEALACGTPVMVSRIPVFMEILGSHALYVDPLNITEISDGIAQCEKKPISSIEERVSRASQFSWQKASSQTLALFERIHENCN
jgi:alpha-1,3-rhamnosyl/mannosyltransferase